MDCRHRGKLIFVWTGALGVLPFVLVSMAICFAVLPVAFTGEKEPSVVPRSRLRLRELYHISPVGMIGCLCIGAANGAFWSLAPIYAQSQGSSLLHISVFMSSAVLGGAVTQWPLGKWSDVIDRRWVISLSSLVAASTAGILIWKVPIDETGSFILAFVFGASALPLYALCIAHANDWVSSEAFVEVSGDLLMMFSVGAIMGPLLAASLMSVTGPQGIFWFTVSVHLALMGFTVSRIGLRRPVSISEKEPFVLVPRTTPAAFPLDPRSTSSERSREKEEKNC